MAQMYSLATLLAIVIPISVLLLLSILLLLIFGFRLKRQKSDIENLSRQTNAIPQDERYNLRKKNQPSSDIPTKSKLKVPWYEKFLFCGGCGANIAEDGEDSVTTKDRHSQPNKAGPHGIDPTNSKSQKKATNSSKKYEGRHEMEFLPSQQNKDPKRSSAGDVLSRDKSVKDSKTKHKSDPLSKSSRSNAKHQVTSTPYPTGTSGTNENETMAYNSQQHALSSKTKTKSKHTRSKSSPKDILDPVPLNINSDGVIVYNNTKSTGPQERSQYDKYHVDPIDDVNSERERQAREVLNRDRVGRNAVSRQHSMNRNSMYSDMPKQCGASEPENGQFYTTLQPSTKQQITGPSQDPPKFDVDPDTISRASTQYKWLDPPISLAKVQHAEKKTSMIGSVVEPLAPMSPISESDNKAYNVNAQNSAENHRDVDTILNGQRKSVTNESRNTQRDSEEYSGTHSFSSSNILYLKSPNILGGESEVNRSQNSQTAHGYGEDDDSSGVDIYTGKIIPNNQSSPYARSTTPASRMSHPSAPAPAPPKNTSSRSQPETSLHNSTSGAIPRSFAPADTYSQDGSGEGYRPLGSTAAKMEAASHQKSTPSSQKSPLKQDMTSNNRSTQSSLDGKVKKRSNNEPNPVGTITSYGTEWHLNRPSNSETASGTGTENTHGTYATAPSRAPHSIREREPRMPGKGNNGLQSSIWGARRSMSTSSRASSLQFSVSDHADISSGYNRKKNSLGSQKSKHKLNKPLPMTPATNKHKPPHVDAGLEESGDQTTTQKTSLAEGTPAEPSQDQEEPQLEQFKEDGVVANLGGMLFTAMFPYNPMLEDELMLTPKDEVKVYQVFDDGWCFARKEVGGVHSHGFCPKVCLANSSRHSKEL